MKCAYCHKKMQRATVYPSVYISEYYGPRTAWVCDNVKWYQIFHSKIVFTGRKKRADRNRNHR